MNPRGFADIIERAAADSGTAMECDVTIAAAAEREGLGPVLRARLQRYQEAKARIDQIFI